MKVEVDTRDFFAVVALLALIQSRAVRREIGGADLGQPPRRLATEVIEEEVDEAFRYADLMMEKSVSAARLFKKGPYGHRERA